jgi:hypothetical protein
MSERKGWLPLWQDTFCTLFVRAGLPGLDRIVKNPVPDLPDNGDGLCFPSPARGHKSGISSAP